ncbi:hypothetical protein G5B00_13690 [Parapedobacter sp. SGR-10]|uniref:hypothetical protein n=1 Tax=Parapedobacter sp. SGR-10 TaxID=2710879 RepID=UPI0013CF8B56|nr:hypothetical protein [Parapedobacter sp. SGR-10]NGF57566.1 hypothetical protein [Parapedobacter sp. SGR-10]
MKRTILYSTAWIMLLLTACGKEEQQPFDHPFLHIMNNNTSSETVNYMANSVRTYNVYLSSKPLTENLEVTFQVTPGNGLKEGVDYEMVTPGNTLVFLPGIYDMPIRVRWMASPALDPNNDNTLTIELVSNSQGITLGLPGPDQLQKKFVITKVR